MKNNIDIDKIASLSGLYISDAERDSLSSEVEKLIRFAEAIADTECTAKKAYTGSSVDSVTRDDIASVGLDQKSLLTSAPSSTDDGYIRVPSVMKEDQRRDNE